jgi:5'-methylthioadenosine phosphorylase
MQNVQTAQRIILDAVTAVPAERTCHCVSALSHAILTRPEAIPAETKRDLGILIGKYVK